MSKITPYERHPLLQTQTKNKTIKAEVATERILATWSPRSLMSSLLLTDTIHTYFIFSPDSKLTNKKGISTPESYGEFLPTKNDLPEILQFRK